MEERPRNAGPPPQQQSTDPGATRYFPPQGGPTTQPQPGPYQAPSAAQPGNGSSTEQPRNTQANAVPPYQQPPQPTNPTNLPYHYQAPADRRARERTILGLILVGGGVLFLLQQFSIFSGFGELILLLIGGIFMYAYFNTHSGYRVGFLIPGAILLGIGVGEVISSLPLPSFWAGGNVTAFTLGLGFCLIWLFERKHWWSLIPGSILILSSMAEMWVFGRLWPLGLIALGAYLLYDQNRRRHVR
jgi:hypothetical protein